MGEAINRHVIVAKLGMIAAAAILGIVVLDRAVSLIAVAAGWLR